MIGLLSDPVAAISSECWGDGGLGAKPPTGSRRRAPGQGVRVNQNVGGVSPRPPYNRRPCSDLQGNIIATTVIGQHIETNIEKYTPKHTNTITKFQKYTENLI